MKLFSMAALALAMAACSNEDSALENAAPAQQPGTMHFTATIAAPSGDATTRTVYTEDGTRINVKWEVGDQIALVYNGVKDIAEVKTVDNVTGKATIEADITGSPSDDDDVYLAYPANAVYNAEPYPSPISPLLPFTPNPITFDKVKNQNGTLEFIQNNLDFRMGSGKLAVSGSDVSLKGSVSVPSLICIWKLTLQDNAATPNALSATQLTFKNNDDTQAKATSAGKNVYYLCVVPSFIPDPLEGTYSFEATVDGDTYTFSKTGLSLAVGKYYQSTVTMAKAPATAYTLAESTVGMIVGSDGNAYDVADKDNLPTGVTAVAMVAYKSATAGSSLAIALADEGSMNWATAKSTCEGKTAIGVNSWKLPSQDEWTLVKNANSGSSLNSAITNAGGTAIPTVHFDHETQTMTGQYWLSTENSYNTDIARVWGINGYDEIAVGDANQGLKTDNLLVRACLAW